MGPTVRLAVLVGEMIEKVCQFVQKGLHQALFFLGKLEPDGDRLSGPGHVGSKSPHGMAAQDWHMGDLTEQLPVTAAADQGVSNPFVKPLG